MEATLLWTLRQLYHSLERQGRQSMRELELSLGQAIVLCWLLSQKGECVCAADLHKALGLSKSALSSTLKELQAKQYLLTVETPEDDRNKRLVLTSRAFANESDLWSALREQQQRLCGDIPAQRLDRLERDLEAMLQRMKRLWKQEECV